MVFDLLDLGIAGTPTNHIAKVTLVQRIRSVGVIAGTVVSYRLVLVVPQSVVAREVLNESPDRSRSKATSCQLPVAGNPPAYLAFLERSPC
jgi:hypothetical protein